MVALLNRVHRNVPGSKDDFLYVLRTLLVVPNPMDSTTRMAPTHSQRNRGRLAILHGAWLPDEYHT
ncbi:hypothetical protein ABIB45_001730 [Arthrobacter sp. UYCo732]